MTDNQVDLILKCRDIRTYLTYARTPGFREPVAKKHGHRKPTKPKGK